MIKELEILVSGHRTNFKFYKSKGYDIQFRKLCLIKVGDLMPGSLVKITSICDLCNKESINRFRDYYNYTNGLTQEYYCNKCNKKRAKKTFLSKYGVENPMQSNEIKAKLKKSLIEKYGVEHYSKTEDYKKKYKETCQEKYNQSNSFQVEEFKEKSKTTSLVKYGVEHYSKTDDFKQKVILTNRYKFGKDSFSQTDLFKQKTKESFLKKYGVNNYSKTDEFKIKVKNTNLEKFGYEYYTQTEEYKNYVRLKKEDLTKFKYDKIIGDEYEVIKYEKNLFTIIHNSCEKEFKINRDTLYSRINIGVCICSECFPIGSQNSYMEIEMQDFLNSLGISYEVNNRKILDGQELDIFIPDFNIALEMNGLYWHSEVYLEKDYHKKKTLKCLERGICLLHIFEDDWKYKRNIVKSIILNKLGLIKNKIFARKCEIKLVNQKEAKLFCEYNHIQGYSPSQLKIGLYFNNELVSLMTFGFRFTNSKREYELIRFCNKLDTTVMGSASKIFNYFLKNYNIDEIVSYCDISIFSGEIYKKLGFRKKHLSEPNYFWVIDGVRKHRFNFNKRKLIKDGFDSNLTEVEIMHSRGYFRIFSTGQEKWDYNKII